MVGCDMHFVLRFHHVSLVRLDQITQSRKERNKTQAGSVSQ